MTRHRKHTGSSGSHARSDMLGVVTVTNRNSIARELGRLGVIPLTVSCRCSPYSFLGTGRLRRGHSSRRFRGDPRSSLVGVRANLCKCGKHVRFRASTYLGRRLSRLGRLGLPGYSLFATVSRAVSQRVRDDCHLFTNGCITYSLLVKSGHFATRCARRRGRRFRGCLRRRVTGISLPGGSATFLHRTLLAVCTGPLVGCLGTTGKWRHLPWEISIAIRPRGRGGGRRGDHCFVFSGLFTSQHIQ